MPPKKRPKLSSSRGPSTPSQTDTVQPSADTASLAAGSKRPDTDYDLVNDPWTDEQETALLKGIIRWKPVGMHKHFRMIAISEYMKSQGYAPAHEEHTRIPGIWKKLGTLYNLPALDEREDAIITDDDSDVYCPFELPEDEYGDLMFARRLALEGSSSPATSGHPESRRGSTVADTDEPRSSPAPSRGRRANRGTRARGTRSTRLQVEIEAPKKGSSDRVSAADEDEEMEDAAANDEEGDEEGTDGGKEDSEAEDELEAETGGSPTTKSTRTQTSRSKQKKPSGAGPGARRAGRRR
ncbi:CT20 family protein [Thermoascus aurantiacus ATCC 26904]